MCPSRRTSSITLSAGSALGGKPLDYAAPYLGPETRDINTVKNTQSTFYGIIVPAEPPQARGMPDYAVRLTSVIDGTSNTILLGEKWLRPDQYLTGAWNDDHNFASSLDQDTLRIGDMPPLQDTNYNPVTNQLVTADVNNPCCDWWRDASSTSPRLGSRFGSAHTAGMNVCMADGSVRFVRYDITPAVFSSLCDRRDGAPLPADF